MLLASAMVPALLVNGPTASRAEVRQCGGPNGACRVCQTPVGPCGPYEAVAPKAQKPAAQQPQQQRPQAQQAKPQQPAPAKVQPQGAPSQPQAVADPFKQQQQQKRQQQQQDAQQKRQQLMEQRRQQAEQLKQQQQAKQQQADQLKQQQAQQRQQQLQQAQQKRQQQQQDAQQKRQQLMEQRRQQAEQLKQQQQLKKQQAEQLKQQQILQRQQQQLQAQQKRQEEQQRRLQAIQQRQQQQQPQPGQPGFRPGAPAAGFVAPAPVGQMPPQVRGPSGGGAATAIGIGVGVGAAVGGAYVLSHSVRSEVEVRTSRQTVVQDGVTYVREPGRVIVREQGGPVFIRHDENERFAVLGYRPMVERDGAFVRTYYDRPDGVRIITVTDEDGRLVRRIRRYHDGREVVIIDNAFRPAPRRIVEQVVVVPPPVLTIPRERYIVDAGAADSSTIYETLTAPPVAPVTKRYTLDEVRYSPNLRAQMRSVDVDTITFDTGSWEIGSNQIDRLSVIAAAINKAVAANPDEVFLIEGHTDAVGDPDDNLSLSDRRAQAVAEVLSKDFAVPAENLTTQGYGETSLKVPTDGESRANRRVTVRRITPLISESKAASGQ